MGFASPRSPTIFADWSRERYLTHERATVMVQFVSKTWSGRSLLTVEGVYSPIQLKAIGIGISETRGFVDHIRN